MGINAADASAKRVNADCRKSTASLGVGKFSDARRRNGSAAVRKYSRTAERANVSYRNKPQSLTEPEKFRLCISGTAERMERGRRCAILPKGIAVSRFSRPLR